MPRGCKPRALPFELDPLTVSFYSLRDTLSAAWYLCILGRVVKALDLSPNGHSPRGFEPRRMQKHFVCFGTVKLSIETINLVPNSIFGRAVKALRSGRSPLCGRGFESHRMHIFYVSARTQPREPKTCILWGSNPRPLRGPELESGALTTRPKMLCLEGTLLDVVCDRDGGTRKYSICSASGVMVTLKLPKL